MVALLMLILLLALLFGGLGVFVAKAFFAALVALLVLALAGGVFAGRRTRA